MSIANFYQPERYTGNVTKVINRVIPSSANRIALLQSGALDMAFDRQASELVRLQNSPGVRVDSLIGNHLQWLGFNAEAGEPLRDLNVRLTSQAGTAPALRRRHALRTEPRSLDRRSPRLS